MNKKIYLSALALFSYGCQYVQPAPSPEDSSVPEAALEQSAQPVNPIDPFEAYNRQIFAFNEQFDHYFMGPAVSVYRTVVPTPFRLGINNFYSNVSEVSCAVNFALQGQWKHSYESSLRFVVNSLFGVGGIFDMAHDLGLPKRRNDFGKTLYMWGYKDSPYSVSPFFGPSTMRDMIGFSVDKMLLNPLFYFNSNGIKTDLFLLNYIETKSNISEYLKNFTETPYVDDKYVFVRDAFLQYRQYQLENGQVNWDSFYEDGAEPETAETSPDPV